MKLIFLKRTDGKCSFGGKSKSNPKKCKRKASQSMRGHKVCKFHYDKLWKLRKQNRW